MKKEDMIDGCWYMVGLGFEGCNPQRMKYVKDDGFTPEVGHLVIFESHAAVHIQRVQRLLSREEYPELYL